MPRRHRRSAKKFWTASAGTVLSVSAVLLLLFLFSADSSISSGFVTLGKSIPKALGLPAIVQEESPVTPTQLPTEPPTEIPSPAPLPTAEPTALPEKPSELPSPAPLPDVSAGNESNESFGKNLMQVVCSEDECGGGGSGGFGRRTNYYYSGGLAARAEVSQSSVLVPLEFMHADYLSSVRAASDSSGASLGRNDFHVFGGSLRESLQSRFKFTGKELESRSGLYFFGARFYQPSAGRFVSADPLFSGAETPYSYAANNPLRFTDPTGMQCEECPVLAPLSMDIAPDPAVVGEIFNGDPWAGDSPYASYFGGSWTLGRLGAAVLYALDVDSPVWGIGAGAGGLPLGGGQSSMQARSSNRGGRAPPRSLTPEAAVRKAEFLGNRLSELEIAGVEFIPQTVRTPVNSRASHFGLLSMSFAGESARNSAARLLRNTLGGTTGGEVKYFDPPPGGSGQYSLHLYARLPQLEPVVAGIYDLLGGTPPSQQLYGVLAQGRRSNFMNQIKSEFPSE
ncbi:MAG: RHS repeat-associated core domain-containing protein [Candidatus Micrarchaeota archaeon]